MKPCLLIPCYDHGAPLAEVLEGLADTGLPCLVIDDGSSAQTRRALAALEARHPFVSVFRRERNGGRGAALASGYRLAAERGFTHTLQLDADGQHACEDVPRFLDCMKADPESLVLGTPRFDASVPKGRLYGRQLSRWMVWLATLSREIDDPLCGFRGLPLAATLAVLDAERCGDHMEFDPQLLILLYRRGARVQTVPTRVRYRPGGLSHFDVVWDDLRLAGVYARALLGLPRQLPALLRRRRARRADERAR